MRKANQRVPDDHPRPSRRGSATPAIPTAGAPTVSRRPLRSRSATCLALALGLGIVTACADDASTDSTTERTTSATEATSIGQEADGPSATTALEATPPTASAGELGQRLAEAGAGCDDFIEVASISPGPTSEGQCAIGDEPVRVYTFADDEDRQSFIDSGGLFDCSFVTGFGGGATIPYVVGDGWVVRTDTEAAADQVASALDGTTEALECASAPG